jgi:hypothetical protein
MRIAKEEYNKAVGCLKRYDYNCINIVNIQSDILSLSIAPNDGLPKAPYSIGDTVFNKVTQLEENKELDKSIKEYKAVVQALKLVDKDSKYIFEKEFRESQTKWKVIADMNVSEETYKRRKSSLIYAVFNELKKFEKN